MTAISYDGTVPDIGADDDAWGGILNTSFGEIKDDLDMLNTAPGNTILGRNEGTTGEVERLTGTEVTAMLSDVVGDSGSGGTKGLVPAAASGAAAKGYVLKASGSFGHPGVAMGGFLGADGSAVGTAVNLTCTPDAVDGVFDFTFGTALASTNYAVFASCNHASTAFSTTISGKTTGGFTVTCTTVADTPLTADPTELYIFVMMLA